MPFPLPLRVVERWFEIWATDPRRKGMNVGREINKWALYLFCHLHDIKNLSKKKKKPYNFMIWLLFTLPISSSFPPPVNPSLLVNFTPSEVERGALKKKQSHVKIGLGKWWCTLNVLVNSWNTCVKSSTVIQSHLLIRKQRFRMFPKFRSLNLGPYYDGEV